MALEFANNNATLINMVNVFKEIAENHGQINSFGYGDNYEQAVKTVTNYPFLWVSPLPARFQTNSVVYNFRFIISDLIQDGDTNLTEVQSDSIQVLSDILYLLRDYYGFDIQIDFQVTPFYGGTDVVSGWYVDAGIEVLKTFGSCDVPFKTCISGSPNYGGDLPGHTCKSCLNFLSTPSIEFSGDGSTCHPLTADVNISALSGNLISILEDGLFASGGTSIIPGSDRQIIFNNNGILDGSSDFTINQGEEIFSALDIVISTFPGYSRFIAFNVLWGRSLFSGREFDFTIGNKTLTGIGGGIRGNNSAIKGGTDTGIAIYKNEGGSSCIEFGFDGSIQADSLAGSGNRMVIADENGLLSTQPISIIYETTLSTGTTAVILPEDHGIARVTNVLILDSDRDIIYAGINIAEDQTVTINSNIDLNESTVIIT